jgi:hypothetical protein
MTYDRDVVVKSLKCHYNVLVRMAYLDPTLIECPPPLGKNDDQLAVEILRGLGRSGKVIDLLQHLPYLCENDNDKMSGLPRNMGYILSSQPRLVRGKDRGVMPREKYISLLVDAF